MNKRFCKILMALLPILFSMEAFGHAFLTSPQARSPDDSLKVGPCGGITPAATPPTTWQAGASVEVLWTETIEHPGRFFVSFSSANDENFQQLAEVIDDKATGDFSTTIQVPDVTCDNCTLQLIQSMEEDPANPRLYFSCSDIRIVNGATTPPETPPNPQEEITTPNQASKEGDGKSFQDGEGPQMASCFFGTISMNQPPPPTGGRALLFFFLILPLLFLLKFRYSQKHSLTFKEA